MTFEEYERNINTLLKLISIEKTGSPKDLATLFNLSERTVRRMIQNLKQPDLDVQFCRKRNSYCFKEIK